MGLARRAPNDPCRYASRVRMEANEVRRLAMEGEGSRAEFKRGLPPDEKVARTLAGFANTRGGLLLVGVEDRGALCGVGE
ncbi:MAG TPA: ATP-binding protein, partial [Planctomycetota bacterium]|nr:ATP-binding protein [Planctomycetota bacterium]